jgi:hypothetical protein
MLCQISIKQLYNSSSIHLLLIQHTRGKCMRGYGTKLVWNSVRSTFRAPSNLKDAVILQQKQTCTQLRGRAGHVHCGHCSCQFCNSARQVAHPELRSSYTHPYITKHFFGMTGQGSTRAQCPSSLGVNSREMGASDLNPQHPRPPIPSCVIYAAVSIQTSGPAGFNPWHVTS